MGPKQILQRDVKKKKSPLAGRPMRGMGLQLPNHQFRLGGSNVKEISSFSQWQEAE